MQFTLLLTLYLLSSLDSSFTKPGCSLLDLYPQVIYHNRYRNQNNTNTQLVWLILECPADGSIKGLCLNFFQAVDDILGTSYYQNYANNGRKTVNELMPYVALAASNVHLGVLVIDEIQRLTKLNVGGYEKILDFFVQLINTIGLSVVLVGTYKAWSVLGSEFRQIRRGTGQGDFIWDRMEEDDDWEIFTDALWQYQYILKPCQRTPELSHALYYECQGITDFAIKVFMLAQTRAISTGKEKLTVGIIKSVAKDCLRTAREVLDALKAGNMDKLRNCEDVRPINIDEFIEEEQQQLSLDDLPTPSSETIERLVNYKIEQQEQVQQQNSDFFKQESIAGQTNVFNDSPRKTRKDSNKHPKNSEGEKNLINILSDGKRSSITAYEALLEAGYIQPINEHFLEIMA
ncbi:MULTISPECIES: ATP-binding protein [Cyanophyceae]|uniref:ATP-binding protein n=1 Tax=Cyanophyceae TaxID=3028117 RepID=UPI001688CE3D|nr:ATP-binding protein [Trichocoleus sp. FACHB-40]MBD2006683.1 ATP-binding protein [Trichocoleus sp. FACHB-40]